LVTEAELAAVRDRNEVSVVEYNGRLVLAVKYRGDMASAVKIGNEQYAIVGVPLYSMYLEYGLKTGTAELGSDGNVYFNYGEKPYRLANGEYTAAARPEGLTYEPVAFYFSRTGNGLNTYYNAAQSREALVNGFLTAKLVRLDDQGNPVFKFEIGKAALHLNPIGERLMQEASRDLYTVPGLTANNGNFSMVDENAVAQLMDSGKLSVVRRGDRLVFAVPY